MKIQRSGPVGFTPQGSRAIVDMRFNDRLVLRIVASAAALSGVLLVLGALGHLYAVVNVKIAHDRPFDSRFVHLLAIGTMLLTVGVIDLVSSWRMWQGVRYGLWLSAGATAVLLGYFVVLLALPNRVDPIRAFFIMQSSYLTIALAGAFYMRLFRTAA